MVKNEELLKEKYNHINSDFNCENEDCKVSIFNIQERIYSPISQRWLCEKCYHEEETDYFNYFDKMINLSCLSLTQDLNNPSMSYLAERIVQSFELNMIHNLDESLKNFAILFQEKINEELEFYNFPPLNKENFKKHIGKILVFIIYYRDLYFSKSGLLNLESSSFFTLVSDIILDFLTHKEMINVIVTDNTRHFIFTLEQEIISRTRKLRNYNNIVSEVVQELTVLEENISLCKLKITQEKINEFDYEIIKDLLDDITSFNDLVLKIGNYESNTLNNQSNTKLMT